MTTNELTSPEAVEKLAAQYDDVGLRDGDSPLAAEAAALISAQAAEIEFWRKDSATAWDACEKRRLEAQEARNAALREAANIVRGEVYLKHYRTWVIWPPYDDLTRERPNVSENHGKARHCDQLADAILALIDTPAPPAEPAGDALLPCPFCGGEPEIIDIEEGENAGGSCVSCTRCFASGNVEFGRKENFRNNWNYRAALAAAPAPQCVACEDNPQPPNRPCKVCGRDAPQPDADEREAMVYLIECTLQEHPAQHESAWHRAHYAADALLDAGWTRKREEG